ncbi:MCM family protein [Pelomyxa schiedti]|nr:MCM family protein [Pelomyxa schiedti]
MPHGARRQPSVQAVAGTKRKRDSSQDHEEGDEPAAATPVKSEKGKAESKQPQPQKKKPRGGGRVRRGNGGHDGPAEEPNGSRDDEAGNEADGEGEGDGDGAGAGAGEDGAATPAWLRDVDDGDDEEEEESQKALDEGELLPGDVALLSIYPTHYWSLGEEEEEAGGDVVDLMDGPDLMNDYAAIPGYDDYDEESLDHGDYEAMSAQQRLAAERELDRRDRARNPNAIQRHKSKSRARNQDRMLTSLLAGRGDVDLDDDPEDSDLGSELSNQDLDLSVIQHEFQMAREAQRSDNLGRDLKDVLPSGDDETPAMTIEELEVIVKEQPGTLKNLGVMQKPRLILKNEFRSFLSRFTIKNSFYYHTAIEKMCAENKCSLVINFAHLTWWRKQMAEWLVDLPSIMIPIFSEAAQEVVEQRVPEYRQIHSVIHTRFSNLLISIPIRNLRYEHFNHLIRIVGVVTRRTAVYPQLQVVKYTCPSCNIVIGPFRMSQDTYSSGFASAPASDDIVDTSSGISSSSVGVGRNSSSGSRQPISHCPGCQSRGPFKINTQATTYRNYQCATVQESPNSVPPGRLPRSRDIVLLDDLIDSAKPGDEIEITGIYKCNFDVALNRSHGFPVFGTLIEANHVMKKDDKYTPLNLLPADERKIRELAADDGVFDKVVASIAPSIFGHTDIKTSLALGLFGGVTRILHDMGSHRLRGDINILLLGDPGTAKSQFLKYISQTGSRAVYTTGRGSTAVGLTASVRKDPTTREWTLEGGALVLADNGICLIDEFDKMNPQDRTSIHEAMEQQSISVSKAGIVTTLSAKCSVFAAANPVKGRYDPNLPFSQNVELTEPILSRFDVLHVVRDKVRQGKDQQLARFIVQSHIQSHPSAPPAPAPALASNPIPQDLLRKYITYAKQIEPMWLPSVNARKVDTQRISSLYAEMRKECELGGGPMICPRHIESILRMSEASARVHLRDHVNAKDIDRAISVMLKSFVRTQKSALRNSMKRKFNKYIEHKGDHNHLLLNILTTMLREAKLLLDSMQSLPASQPPNLEIEKTNFESRAKEMGILDCRGFYLSSLFQSQYNLTNTPQHVSVIVPKR